MLFIKDIKLLAKKLVINPTARPKSTRNNNKNHMPRVSPSFKEPIFALSAHVNNIDANIVIVTKKQQAENPSSFNPEYIPMIKADKIHIEFNVRNHFGSTKNTKSFKIKLSVENNKNPKDKYRKIFSGFR